MDSGAEHVFAPDQGESTRLSILDYWRVVRRYKWSILAVAFIAGVVGTLNALSATSMYQAKVRLWIKYNQPNISAVQFFEAAPMHWLFFQTQADIVQSHAVAERVVDRLGLKDSGADGKSGQSADAAERPESNCGVQELVAGRASPAPAQAS